MRKFLKSPTPFQIAVTSIAAILATVTIVVAATTVGDNISTGTLTFTTASSTGAVKVDSLEVVTGATTLDSTLNVTGQATLVNASSTAQTIASLFFGTASSTGAASLASASVTGTLNVTGKTTLVNSSTTAGTVTSLYFGTASSTGAAALASLSVTGDTSLNTASSTGLVKIEQASIGGNAAVTGLLTGSCNADFGTSLSAGLATTTNCTASGVTTAYKVFVTPTYLEKYVAFNGASSTADNIIQIAVFNTSTSTAITTAAHAWNWMAIK